MKNGGNGWHGNGKGSGRNGREPRGRRPSWGKRGKPEHPDSTERSSGIANFMTSAGRPTEDFKGNGGGRKKRKGSRERPKGSNGDSNLIAEKPILTLPFGKLVTPIEEEEKEGGQNNPDENKGPASHTYKRRVFEFNDA